MPHFATSHEWFEQSALLLDANPTTTRVTTKYTTARPRKAQLRAKSSKQTSGTDEQHDAAIAADASNAEGSLSALHQPRAILVLKTFEPHSGVCLKYETDKAAEIGRIIGTLGRLGKKMAALPEESDDAVKAEETAQVDGDGVTPTAGASLPKGSHPQGQSQGQGGAGGKKKKKKKK